MFDFYFTGVAHNSPIADFLLEKEGTCVLLSQLNERRNIYKWIERIKESNSPIKLFIDSGAFSAWTKGKLIDVDEYISFINTYKDYLTVCASVDTIPGKPRTSYIASQEDVAKAAQGTWENFLYMRSKMDDVDKLLYTFHAGEPWEFLERALNYTDERGPINYIAFGGLVGKSKDVIITFLAKAFELVSKCDNKNLKIHAFGMTRLDVLEEYPFTSADSTSWLQTANFGSITMGSKNICLSDRKLLSDDNLINKNTALIEDVKKRVEEKGFNLQQLQEDSNARLMFNVMNFYDWSLNYKCKFNPMTKIELF